MNIIRPLRKLASNLALGIEHEERKQNMEAPVTVPRESTS